MIYWIIHTKINYSCLARQKAMINLDKALLFSNALSGTNFVLPLKGLITNYEAFKRKCHKKA